ncbi:hypothetical protein LTR08_005111 [Meristemomyces frigidus]|nr:hypothetical protein LTR08_005111 [Meristemomyces frigidus]
MSILSHTPESAPSTETRLHDILGHPCSAALGEATEQDKISDNAQLETLVPLGMLSPPTTPLEDEPLVGDAELRPLSEVDVYDFEKLDYELQRAKVLGRGLWSTVLLADAKHPPRAQGQANSRTLQTPPPSPQQGSHQTGISSIFAVKTPARPDAPSIFKQEAKILTSLMRRDGAARYVVAFYGLDLRNHALVFEVVIGGSLENLLLRLQQMTEVARHVELVSLFPGLANDLVCGLEFLHAAGVVHADIKGANVLLDMYEDDSRPQPVIRARYIDFSASFRHGSDDSSANAGGTWDYMAPEQLRIQKDLSTPTFASDIWSLGMTLLYLMVGESPYAAACGHNTFMLREAIKSGDPLGFARMSSKAQKRMAAAQDFVDCCRLALNKDRDRRPTASAWKAWLKARS